MRDFESEQEFDDETIELIDAMSLYDDDDGECHHIDDKVAISSACDATIDYWQVASTLDVEESDDIDESACDESACEPISSIVRLDFPRDPIIAIEALPIVRASRDSAHRVLCAVREARYCIECEATSDNAVDMHGCCPDCSGCYICRVEARIKGSRFCADCEHPDPKEITRYGDVIARVRDAIATVLGIDTKDADNARALIESVRAPFGDAPIFGAVVSISDAPIVRALQDDADAFDMLRDVCAISGLGSHEWLDSAHCAIFQH